jgi:hypothetical protein
MTEDAALTGAGVQAVTENMLETGAVTATKIGANAVTESRILNSAVTNAKIAAGAVNAAKIQNGTVGSDELAANCVTSAKIGANQVTSAQIADNSIGYTEISNANADAVKAAVETEAASSPITPDVLRYSPFSPRCYGVVSYDESTPTIASGSFNVASVSEPSDDKRTVTFAVPFTNTNYVVVATMQTSTTVGDNEKVSITAKATSSFTMESFHNDAANLSINFVVFGSTLS